VYILTRHCREGLDRADKSRNAFLCPRCRTEVTDQIPVRSRARTVAGWGKLYSMASGIEIGSLIERDPKIRGGRPKITGTGLAISRIAGWYKLGMSPEEIALEYPHLTLAHVFAALTYYHVNRDEIEADIAAEEAAALHWEEQLAPQPAHQ